MRSQLCVWYQVQFSNLRSIQRVKYKNRLIYKKTGSEDVTRPVTQHTQEVNLLNINGLDLYLVSVVVVSPDVSSTNFFSLS